jgi:hypothetical protein
MNIHYIRIGQDGEHNLSEIESYLVVPGDSCSRMVD